MFIQRLMFNPNVYFVVVVVVVEDGIAAWFTSRWLEKVGWSELVFQLAFCPTLSKWGNAERLEPHGRRDFLGCSLLASGWTEQLYSHAAGIWFHHSWPSTDSEKRKEVWKCIYNPQVFCVLQTRELAVVKRIRGEMLSMLFFFFKEEQ